MLRRLFARRTTEFRAVCTACQEALLARGKDQALAFGGRF
jgi:hypothetical protein